MDGSLLEKSRALFIRRWGEMGASWGISRTMAEIHALLFISNVPLCTDDLMAELQISRGNASMNLRQLVAWGLIHRVHQRGDRKECFLAETDVWLMFETIAKERRRREIEPIFDTIDKCRTMLSEEMKGAKGGRRKDIDVFGKRLSEMQEFFTMANSLFNAVVKVGKTKAGKVLKALSKLAV